MDWNELSMRERAAYIREGVAQGLQNLNDIKNKYVVGGFTLGNSGGFNNAFSRHFKTTLNLPTSKPVVVKDKPKQTASLRDYSVNFGNSNKGLKEQFLRHLERYFQKHPNSEFNTPEWRQFITNLVATESGYSYGSDNNLNADNRIGARGYFQLMPASRRKGNWSSQDEQFEDAFNYLQNNLNYLRNNLSNADMEALRNQGIDIYGLMAAAHLGGAGGATKWARSRGRHNPSDGNTNLTSYAMTHTLMPHRWLDEKGKMQEGFNLWEPTDYYATYTPPQTGVSDEEVLQQVDQALSLQNNNPQYEKVEQPQQNLFAEFAHQQELDRREQQKQAMGILQSLSADNIQSKPMIMPTESALYNDVFGSLFDSGGPIKKPTFMPEQDGQLNWPALQAVDVGYYPAQIDIPGGVETFVPNQYVGINPQDYEANRIIYREDGEPLLNPNYGHNSIVYKPEVNNNDSLALEGLHVMHEDPSYEAMFIDLKDQLLQDKSVLGDIMFNQLYEQRDGESEKDAIEKTEKKINRFIKNLEENKLDPRYNASRKNTANNNINTFENGGSTNPWDERYYPGNNLSPLLNVNENKMLWESLGGTYDENGIPIIPTQEQYPHQFGMNDSGNTFVTMEHPQLGRVFFNYGVRDDDAVNTFQFLKRNKDLYDAYQKQLNQQYDTQNLTDDGYMLNMPIITPNGIMQEPVDNRQYSGDMALATADLNNNSPITASIQDVIKKSDEELRDYWAQQAYDNPQTMKDRSIWDLTNAGLAGIPSYINLAAASGALGPIGRAASLLATTAGMPLATPSQLANLGIQTVREGNFNPYLNFVNNGSNTGEHFIGEIPDVGLDAAIMGSITKPKTILPTAITGTMFTAPNLIIQDTVKDRVTREYLGDVANTVLMLFPTSIEARSAIKGSTITERNSGVRQQQTINQALRDYQEAQRIKDEASMQYKNASQFRQEADKQTAVARKMEHDITMQERIRDYNSSNLLAAAEGYHDPDIGSRSSLQKQKPIDIKINVEKAKGDVKKTFEYNKKDGSREQIEVQTPLSEEYTRDIKFNPSTKEFYVERKGFPSTITNNGEASRMQEVAGEIISDLQKEIGGDNNGVPLAVPTGSMLLVKAGVLKDVPHDVDLITTQSRYDALKQQLGVTNERELMGTKGYRINGSKDIFYDSEQKRFVPTTEVSIIEESPSGRAMGKNALQMYVALHPVEARKFFKEYAAKFKTKDTSEDILREKGEYSDKYGETGASELELPITAEELYREMASNPEAMLKYNIMQMLVSQKEKHGIRISQMIADPNTRPLIDEAIHQNQRFLFGLDNTNLPSNSRIYPNLKFDDIKANEEFLNKLGFDKKLASDVDFMKTLTDRFYQCYYTGIRDVYSGGNRTNNSGFPVEDALATNFSTLGTTAGYGGNQLTSAEGGAWNYGIEGAIQNKITYHPETIKTPLDIFNRMVQNSKELNNFEYQIDLNETLEGNRARIGQLSRDKDVPGAHGSPYGLDNGLINQYYGNFDENPLVGLHIPIGEVKHSMMSSNRIYPFRLGTGTMQRDGKQPIDFVSGDTQTSDVELFNRSNFDQKVIDKVDKLEPHLKKLWSLRQQTSRDRDQEVARKAIEYAIEHNIPVDKIPTIVENRWSVPWYLKQEYMDYIKHNKDINEAKKQHAIQKRQANDVWKKYGQLLNEVNDKYNAGQEMERNANRDLHDMFDKYRPKDYEMSNGFQNSIYSIVNAATQNTDNFGNPIVQDVVNGIADTMENKNISDRQHLLLERTLRAIFAPRTNVVSESDLKEIEPLLKECFGSQYNAVRKILDTYSHSKYQEQKKYGGSLTHSRYIKFDKGGKIHIKEKNKGKFSAAAKRAGMSTQAYASHVLANKSRYSPTLVKRANFARNASKWKHSYGGPLIYAGHQGYVRI